MNESCSTYQWVVGHDLHHTYDVEVTDVSESCLTYEWVMSRIWMSHVPHINESWVMTYITLMARLPMWVSQVSHINESCHAYEWVMFHISMIQICRTCEWVMAHAGLFDWVMSRTWMSHVSWLACASHDGEVMRTDVNESCLTHMNESCSTCQWVRYI